VYWKYQPTNDELMRYRKSWNPFSHGPILANSPDVQPKSQWLIQAFVFSEFGDRQFGNKFGTNTSPAPVKLKAIAPTFWVGYGITDNVELDVVPSFIWYDAQTNPAFSASSGTPTGHKVTPNSDLGVGDTTIYLKWRLRVQDPDTWHPTFTLYNAVTLPSSQWFGTDPIPGGFAPLGRLPATKFGGLGLTEGIMFRKNIEPFRFMASVYYTYTAPGSTAGQSTYNGDIINTRLIAEWIANDKRGLGFNLEFLSVHGLDYRLDGHDLNIKPTSFNLLGVEPSAQYTLFYNESGGLAAAAGCILSIAGQNDIMAFYPNISLYYYWAKAGAPLMR
jgi:hypothetical protein